jgi:hypothetical protein
MTKSSDHKGKPGEAAQGKTGETAQGKTHETAQGKAGETPVEKKRQEYAARGAAVGAEAAAEIDAIEVQGRAQNVLIQLAEAREKKEPEKLQWVDGDPAVPWSGLIAAQIERVQSEAAKPGGLEARPPPVPKAQRIQTANELADETYKRVETATAPNRWEKAANAERRQTVFAERAVPGSRAGWTIELSSIRKAIVAMGDSAPAALRELLPRIDEALAALEGSKAQQAGRPRATAYAAPVLEAAVALDLMLGDLLAWATSQAVSQRYGNLARAIHPKRRNDAVSEPGSKGDGAAAGASNEKGSAGSGAPVQKSEAAAAEPKSGAEPKNGATAPAAQA